VTRPTLVVRADASHAIGLGHVARLAAVIEALGPGDAAPIAMIGGDPALGPWLRRHGIAADPRPWTTADVLAAAADPGVRAVVIDGPPLAAALAPALAERGVRTVVIDDRGGLALPIEAVVNHNVHAPELAASYPAARLRLLGRDYLMLRHAIRRHARGACRPRATPRLRVVVTFGGSDPVGATARALRAIPADRPLDVVAIAGPGFRDHAALRLAARAAAAAGHAVELVDAPDDTGGLFVAADAAICSAGGTLGELAYLGCPALGFAIVPDQVAGARAQALGGLIAGGGAWSDTGDDALAAELRGFLGDDARRRALRDAALATADGGGARRIIAEALS
jgi:spore coat polysaccharide biosynthesis predicted glycosyltransferase SpsG